MSIFKKSGYLRVLFMGLPFGVASLLGGIQMFNEIPDTPKDLKLHVGKLVSHGDTVYYSKAVDLERSVYYLRVNNEIYYTDRRKEREVIENYNYSIGDSITIWTEPGGVYIKQLTANNEMVMNYRPPYWMAWFFTVTGVVFTTMSLFYLIKYSSDYFGDQDLDK